MISGLQWDFQKQEDFVAIKDKKSKLVEGSESGRFSSEPLQGEAGTYNGFAVLFHRCIVLAKITPHCIEATITGDLLGITRYLALVLVQI